MTKKAGMRSHREKRNRQAFAQRFPAVLQAIAGIGQRSTFLVEDDGVPVNIELGGALLYPGAAPAYTCAQLQAFRADPDRLGFTDPSHCNLSPISLKLLDDLVRYMRDRGLTTRLAQYPVADVGYLFVFGVGLGRHLEALLTEISGATCRSDRALRRVLVALPRRRRLAEAVRHRRAPPHLVPFHPGARARGDLSRDRAIDFGERQRLSRRLLLFSTLSLLDISGKHFDSEGMLEGVLQHQRILRRRSRNDPQLPRQSTPLGSSRGRAQALSGAELPRHHRRRRAVAR